jgi:hypothetical protein
MSKRGERGNAMVEFALVMAFLIPMFAGLVTLSMALAKGIQVSNVAWDAVVLMVSSNTNPNSGLDLSQTQNQRIIVRAANGLGMNSDAQYDPSSTGSAVVILSKIGLVGPLECSQGTTGKNPPWSSSNCPNYNQYVFEYRVVIGNGTRWSSAFGSPPSGIVANNGTITAANIATNTSNRASNLGSGGVLTLSPSTFTLVSEMYADVSYLNFFSIWQTPILYSRNLS